MNARAHVLIYGDVTGVGFRAWTYRIALELGLSGWVRNADRGIVEAVFEGKKEAVEDMIKQCRKGPEVAWVEKIDVKRYEATGEFDSFEIIIS